MKTRWMIMIGAILLAGFFAVRQLPLPFASVAGSGANLAPVSQAWNPQMRVIVTDKALQGVVEENRGSRFPFQH